MQLTQLGKVKIPRLHLFMLLLATVLMVTIAWPAKFFFLNDDLIHIPLAGTGQIGHHNSVRYVGDFSLMLDHYLYGKSATGYHITNLLLHIGNVLLLWRILYSFFLQYTKSINHWLIIYPVFLFAFFGFHSDAIFWIIGRSASLASLFFLLTIYCLQHVDKGILYKAGIFLFWLAALFSYESVWIFPIMIVIVPVIFGSTSNDNKYIKPGLILFIWVTFGTYLVIRRWATAEWLGTYEAASFQTFKVGDLLINYFKLVIRTFIPPNHDTKQFILLGFIFLVILSIAFVLLVLRKKYDKIWLYVTACWLLSYLPYLSLGISTKSIESERFLYLPSLFFSITLCYTLFLLFEKNLKFFHLICLSVIFFNGAYFVKASGIFRQNGKLVAETYSVLNKNQLIHALEIRKIPHTNFGVPVFRSGFIEGYQWLVTPSHQIKLTIVDYEEYYQTNIKPEILIKDNLGILNFGSLPPLQDSSFQSMPLSSP